MIPIVITAKNEETCIYHCLTSIIRSIDNLRKSSPFKFQIYVVLDDCTDETENIVCTFENVIILRSSGGIVEAQRIAVNSINADFIVFSDADIYVEEKALVSIIQTMLNQPDLHICYPKKTPIKPIANTLIANALYSYNINNGFQSKRHYFNGRLFAIRNWFIPTPDSFSNKPDCHFYKYQEGIRCDDIFLSRRAFMLQGKDSIKEVSDGRIYYRPPETYTGMYRTYKRMRMEIERLNILFPESLEAHNESGVRTYNAKSKKDASTKDVLYWYLFRFFLQICKLNYVTERLWFKNFTQRDCKAWEVIAESKHPILFDYPDQK